MLLYYLAKYNYGIEFAEYKNACFKRDNKFYAKVHQDKNGRKFMI